MKYFLTSSSWRIFIHNRYDTFKCVPLHGLIGDPKDPKIYGAGLLSSIGESKWCMRDEVEKLPYSIAAAKQNFDITSFITFAIFDVSFCVSLYTFPFPQEWAHLHKRELELM